MRRKNKWLRASSKALDKNVLIFGSESHEFVAAAEGTDGVPKFSIRAYSGGPLRMPQFKYPIIVNLSGLTTTDKNRPALLDHDTKQRVGHTTQVLNAGSHLDVLGLVSAKSPAALEVVEAAKNGFPWQASIGVQLRKSPELISAGKTVQVNGRAFTGPLYVANATAFREISFCALGVDDDTAASIAASLGGSMDPKFAAWLEASGFIVAELNETQTKVLEASYKASLTPPADPPAEPPKKGKKVEGEGDDPPADLNAADADRMQRVADIRTICAKYENPTFEISEGDKKTVVDLAAHAVREGWTVEKVELTAMRGELSKKAPAAHSHSSIPLANKSKVIECALLRRCVDNDEEYLAKHYDKETIEASLNPEMRMAANRPLSYLMHEAIRASGKYVNPVTSGDALEQEYIQASSAISTISLPGILGNVAHKSALRAFRAVPDVWRAFSGVGTVTDFKTYTSYQMTGNGEMEEVGADGELKHRTLVETSYTNKAKTYGAMFAFTRQDVINDDLGLLDTIRSILGRQAALRLNKAVFTAFMAADSFFSAGNKNLVTSNALALAGLGAAVNAFRKQVDADDQPIEVSPMRILVPSTLEVTAKQLYVSTTLNETTTANVPKPATNIYSNTFEPVTSVYLNAQGIVGSSDTTWYMVSNPADMAPMQVVFLNGNQTPIIESQPASFNVLGVQFRGYFDFGVARWIKQAAIKCTA